MFIFGVCFLLYFAKLSAGKGFLYTRILSFYSRLKQEDKLASTLSTIVNRLVGNKGVQQGQTWPT